MRKWIPRSFLVRLTVVNVAFISLFTFITGIAIYQTACFLVEGMNSIQSPAQRQFKSTLFQYLWFFSLLTVIAGSVVQFFVTKRLIYPIRQMIDSTRQLKSGTYNKVILKSSNDEMRQLVTHFNSLTDLLEQNEKQRHKVLTDMAHEFRTPLSNLNGYLTGLKNGVISGDQDLYHSLLHESERLTQMVEQLEQLKEWDMLTHEPILTKEPVRVTSLVQEVVRAFEWSFDELNIPLQMKLDDAKVPLHTTGVQQVLSNLLRNALQYYQGNEAILVLGESMEETYRISIISEGQPIPPSHHQKVFLRFYRSDPSRSRSTGGSGLGLSISKEIIEQHQGQIWLETNGTKHAFTFELPL